MSIFNRSAISAGLIAGLVFLILEMVLVATVGGGTPWAPPRMIAAIVMGDGVLPPPADFNPVIVLIGFIVHFVLSVVLALIFAAIVTGRGLTLATTVIAGIVFGLIIYGINFYLMTELFPWFAMARNWISVLAHAVFGGVLGWVYFNRAARVVTVDRVA